jgi:hypothetical protein
MEDKTTSVGRYLYELCSLLHRKRQLQIRNRLKNFLSVQLMEFNQGNFHTALKYFLCIATCLFN